MNLTDLFPTIGLPARHRLIRTTSWLALATGTRRGTDDVNAPCSANITPWVTSAAFMLRRGRYKYHYYVGFEPELFDLELDPEETTDLAGDLGIETR